MKPSRRLGLTAVLASATAAASITLAGTASADPPLNERFHDEFTDVIDGYCGTLIHSGGPVSFMEHVNGTFVDTNLANGNAISGSFNTMQRAIDAIDNGDGTLTVTFLATGNDVTYGPDGRRSLGTPARSGSSS
jgi:hypothetical protein